MVRESCERGLTAADLHDQRRQDGGVGGRLDPRRPSSPEEIRVPSRRGLGCPGWESVHLDPLVRWTRRVRSKGLRVLRLLGPKIDETRSGTVDRKGRELVRDLSDRATAQEMTGLLVADHFDQEVDEIGGLDYGAAILAIPQGRERRLAGDVDVPSARGTGVNRSRFPPFAPGRRDYSRSRGPASQSVVDRS